jgi:two-component system, chemotaxis family, response regulator PixG
MGCTLFEYNGKLEIQSSRGYRWKFVCESGRVVWASGGIQPFRRFRRYMAKHCPQVDVDRMELRLEDMASEYWDYRLLEKLYSLGTIQREQIHHIANEVIAELLFDVIQQNHCNAIKFDNSSVGFQPDSSPKEILEALLSSTSQDASLKPVHELWSAWLGAGLENISPNLAPMLRDPEQLKKLVNPTIYQNFVNMMVGKQTLRDLAVKVRQDVLSVSRSLLPYISTGIIELVEVGDLPLPKVKDKSSLRQPGKSCVPLIACVDDSSQVIAMLKQIILPNGMRFVGIQDPVNILPTLIEQKPDLIFLDLMMPITNGYEICSKLRKISTFSNTPIIILTGSDGIFDRVRARVVGSTDFITKPILSDKVIATVRKHLHTFEPVKNASNLQPSYA